MYNNKDVSSNEIQFISGNQIEIYFPEEKIEYRFTVSSKEFPGFEDHIVVDLPQEFKNTFYKGEDFIQCKYVSDNIVYQFGGEIIKIVYENKSYIIIKKPANLQKGSHRTKQRVITQILCEYFVQKVVPGEFISRMQGFATIKDASVGGLSLLTTDTFPNSTVLKLVLNKTDIVVYVEIMNFQKVNDKNFYGGKIVGFDNGGEKRYKDLLESIINREEAQTFVGEIY